MNNYFIVNETGKGLSEFHPGEAAKRTPFFFKKNSVMSFPTIEEAEKALQNIITRTPAKFKPAVLHLRVSMYAKGF